MIPAEAKKRENIAEYIVHMYQTEDLIVTYDFNLDDILQYVISHMSKEEAELKEILLWYAGVIDEMQQEKLPEQGRRLSSTQEFVARLSTIHSELFEKDEAYQEIFNKARTELEEQSKLSGGKITDPVQLCINAVYGRLVISLSGKKLPESQEEMVERFGNVLAYLAGEFHQSE